MSEAERALVRRSATIIVALEQMELTFATSEEPAPNQLELYQRLSNTLRRLLEAVGLKRRQRDVTPSLHDYLTQKRTRVGTRTESAG